MKISLVFIILEIWETEYETRKRDFSLSLLDIDSGPIFIMRCRRVGAHRSCNRVSDPCTEVIGSCVLDPRELNLTSVQDQCVL